MTPKRILTPEEQAGWLNQHLETRMRAAKANRNFIAAIRDSFQPGSQYHAMCDNVFHAAWEGQHAALRWLIEFVGVKPPKFDDDVNILCFPGGVIMAAKDNPDLVTLWDALSKFTAHPTDSNVPHSEASVEKLLPAATKIEAHLRATIYTAAAVAEIQNELPKP